MSLSTRNTKLKSLENNLILDKEFLERWAFTHIDIQVFTELEFINKPINEILEGDYPDVFGSIKTLSDLYEYILDGGYAEFNEKGKVKVVILTPKQKNILGLKVKRKYIVTSHYDENDNIVKGTDQHGETIFTSEYGKYNELCVMRYHTVGVMIEPTYNVSSNGMISCISLKIS